MRGRPYYNHCIKFWVPILFYVLIIISEKLTKMRHINIITELNDFLHRWRSLYGVYAVASYQGWFRQGHFWYYFFYFCSEGLEFNKETLLNVTTWPFPKSFLLLTHWLNLQKHSTGGAYGQITHEYLRKIDRKDAFSYWQGRSLA